MVGETVGNSDMVDSLCENLASLPCVFGRAELVVESLHSEISEGSSGIWTAHEYGVFGDIEEDWFDLRVVEESKLSKCVVS